MKQPHAQAVKDGVKEDESVSFKDIQAVYLLRHFNIKLVVVLG